VWISEDHDFDVMDESFAEDAVVEYPPSGERIRGRRNIRAVEEDYSGTLQRLACSDRQDAGVELVAGAQDRPGPGRRFRLRPRT
jgi:hypothetical protein